jgi:hypothetical protein
VFSDGGRNIIHIVYPLTALLVGKFADGFIQGGGGRISEGVGFYKIKNKIGTD